MIRCHLQGDRLPRLGTHQHELNVRKLLPLRSSERETLSATKHVDVPDARFKHPHERLLELGCDGRWAICVLSAAIDKARLRSNWEHADANTTDFDILDVDQVDAFVMGHHAVAKVSFCILHGPFVQPCVHTSQHQHAGFLLVLSGPKMRVAHTKNVVLQL